MRSKLQVIVYILSALVILVIPDIFIVQIAAGQNAQPISSQIDQYIRGQMVQQNIVGLSVAVVQNNEVTYLQGFGAASLKRGTQVTPQTIFDLASCSKSFTATAALLLWNDGLIDLDQPVKHYIPEFQLADETASVEITVRELLNQTSGLPGDLSEPLDYQKGSDTVSSDTMKLLVGALKNLQTDRSPGSSFEYANLNYCLLGALVERVSGESFSDFVQERIFTPLGMNNSTLNPDIAASLDRAD